MIDVYPVHHHRQGIGGAVGFPVAADVTIADRQNVIRAEVFAVGRPEALFSNRRRECAPVVLAVPEQIGHGRNNGVIFAVESRIAARIGKALLAPALVISTGRAGNPRLLKQRPRVGVQHHHRNRIAAIAGPHDGYFRRVDVKRRAPCVDPAERRDHVGETEVHPVIIRLALHRRMIHMGHDTHAILHRNHSDAHLAKPHRPDGVIGRAEIVAAAAMKMHHDRPATHGHCAARDHDMQPQAVLALTPSPRCRRERIFARPFRTRGQSATLFGISLR